MRHAQLGRSQRVPWETLTFWGQRFQVWPETEATPDVRAILEKEEKKNQKVKQRKALKEATLNTV